MNTAKIVRSAGIAIASVVVAGSVVAVTAYASGVSLVPMAAASPSPTASPSKSAAYCDKFTQHLASDLKTSESNLQSQVKNAAQQTIDDAVKAGDLTQAQADKLKSRLASSKSLCGPLAGLGHNPGGPHENAGLMEAGLDAAAATVNMTPDQLKEQLKAGKTLSQVAPAGMTQEQFTTQFTDNLKKQLDARVQSGKLTQAQEDKILHAAPALAAQLWNHGLEHAAKPHPAPSASPTS
jgi:polyhydroxyalkanoate synthesis regulator phasin